MIKKITKLFPTKVKAILKHPLRYYSFTKISIESIQKLSRNNIYNEFLFNFRFLHKDLIDHRIYFNKENMGYGESAFHTLWFYLISFYKPKEFLEIGVYRGQIISLVSLIAKKYYINTFVSGLSPFTEEGDGVSKYINIDFLEDTKNNFKYFNLDEPTLIRARSDDEEGVNFIKSKKWDMVYIDGNHDYEVVRKDFQNIVNQLNSSGILILDDSSLYTNFFPEQINVSAFRGHPGPSQVLIENFNNKDLTYLFGIGHINIFKKK